MKPTKPSSQQPKRSAVWIVLAVMLAVVSVGALWWWKTTGTVPVGGTCQPVDLTLSLGEPQTADDTEFIHAVLTNKGNASCTLNGYPVVSLLDKNGENFSYGDAQNNDFYAAESVTLTPRGQAHAVVGLPKASTFRAGDCSGTMATLRVYLPGEITPATQALSVPLERQTCPGFSVTAIRPGA